jgi:hypothetical protein
LNELSNGVENISTPQNGFDDGREVVVKQDYARGGDSDFSTRYTHAEANVRGFESWRVVCSANIVICLHKINEGHGTKLTTTTTTRVNSKVGFRNRIRIRRNPNPKVKTMEIGFMEFHWIWGFVQK